MRLDEPSWWYPQGRTPAIARALRPAGALYGWAVKRRFRSAQPYHSALPVICVGNLTVGGTGKTPLSLRIARELTDLGERPAFLTRGYGGRLSGPHVVDPNADTAADVGDEPLLLASVAPTVVSRDRAAGARAIEANVHASVIVMDDGLQNPSLCKELSIAVVDARRGFGNGEVLPAGPLRAPLDFQLSLIDAVVINTPPGAGDSRKSINFDGPIIQVSPEPRGDATWVNGARLVAYAGIANPGRFFDLLKGLGGQLVETVSLPDHHAFSTSDAESILQLAKKNGAIPVTTEKDFARLKGGQGSIAELLARSRTVGIQLALGEPDAAQLRALLVAALERSRRSQ